MQKMLCPITCVKGDYNKIIAFLKDMNVDYSESKWFNIYIETLDTNCKMKTITALIDTKEVEIIKNKFNMIPLTYNFDG